MAAQKHWPHLTRADIVRIVLGSDDDLALCLAIANRFAEGGFDFNDPKQLRSLSPDWWDQQVKSYRRREEATHDTTETLHRKIVSYLDTVYEHLERRQIKDIMDGLPSSLSEDLEEALEEADEIQRLYMAKMEALGKKAKLRKVQVPEDDEEDDDFLLDLS